MSDLRKKLIRLAYSKPETRDHILPLLKASTHGPHRISRSVAANYEQTASYVRKNGKDVTVGKFARVTMARGWVFVEELPEKGKKRLKWLMFNFDWMERQYNQFILPNIKSRLNISKGDTFSAIERKIEDAIVEIAMEMEKEGTLPAEDVYKQVNLKSDEVWYLKVAPASADPISAAGEDFTVKSTYTAFKVQYSYNSDPYDPAYTMVESTSATAGRKLYKILNNDPDALSRVSWDDFTGWLKKNKIKYKMWSSSWR